MRLHAFRRERGLLLVQVASVLAVLAAFADARALAGPVFLASVAAGLLAIAGLLLPHRPVLARVLALGGVGCAIASVAPAALEHPELLVLGALALWALGHLVLAEPNLHTAERDQSDARRTAFAASLLALGVWFAGVLAVSEPTAFEAAFTSAPIATATLLSLRWTRSERSRRWLWPAMGALAIVSVAGALAVAAEPALALSCLAAVPFATVVLARGDGEAGALAGLLEHPARLLVATFFALATIGTAVLALPAASASAHAVGILDAAFTSMSAVCVTGLIVLDTPSAFSPFGQVAILALIQVGGLGIMTFYTVAFAALGRRLSLRHERAIAGAMNVDDRRQLVGSLRRVLLVTFAAEAIGAVALFAGFVHHGDGVSTAAWRAAFTSVSAFCNAGFALQTDSLIPYQSEPSILYTVAALIVAGGLSPIGVLALPRWLRGHRVGLQERIVLVTSSALLLAGALLYALFEWSDSLGDLSWADRVHNAIFQSVTLRTAGFNSVDLAVSRPETQTMMIAFMLIGGSPGGTAGGVKTSTLAVIVLMVMATLRGRRDAAVFGRQLGGATVFKSGAVVTVGVAAFLVALMAMQLTQTIELDVAGFEVASALGTVGLSIGGTAMLDSVGKILVMACMFAGRVGPLTLFLFLTEQQHERPLGHPVQEIDVG